MESPWAAVLSTLHLCGREVRRRKVDVTSVVDTCDVNLILLFAYDVAAAVTALPISYWAPRRSLMTVRGLTSVPRMRPCRVSVLRQVVRTYAFLKAAARPSRTSHVTAR
jgi:hypothetical protein